MSHQMVGTDPGRQWGIRSLATGRVYPWATSQRDAEFMWAGTGAPQRYEVVHWCGDEWIAEPSVTLPPTPAFAKEPLRERVGDDDEIIRMAVCLTDPTYGKKVEPSTVSAAEIRHMAEQRRTASVNDCHAPRCGDQPQELPRSPTPRTGSRGSARPKAEAARIATDRDSSHTQSTAKR